MDFATSSRLSVSPYKNASIDSTSIHMNHSIPINTNTLPLFDKRRMPAHFATNCSCVCILSGAKEKSHSTILYRVNARERLNTPNRSPVIDHTGHTIVSCGPRQANLVLIAYASSEGSGEPAHPRSLARTFAARS